MNATIVNELADVVRELLATERKAHAAEVEGLRAELSDLREQIKAIPAPIISTLTIEGPPGPAGERGEKGQDAEPVDTVALAKDVLALVPVPRDGRDASAVLTDEIRAEIGKAAGVVRFDLLTEIRKDLAVLVDAHPWPAYQNVFKQGETYRAGTFVTWAGSLWHADEDTSSKPGNGNPAWTLAVKRGNDGKDAK